MSVSELPAQPKPPTARPRGLRRPWLPIAGVLAGAGWGSNQFTPMLLVYHTRLGLSTTTLEALFGAYAAGLIPGLLLAGRWSDGHGRRPAGIAAAALSLLASASLIAGAHALVWLFVGRLVAGAGSGAAFGAGTAWLRETSLPPFGEADHGTVARRAAVAMTTGFALGPLVAGVLAQWAPHVTVVPYLPHLALMLALLFGVMGVPETVRMPERSSAAVRLTDAGARQFRRLVLPMAPWVFAAPAIAFALLPSIVSRGHADAVALSAGITSLTAVAGVAIQPLARRLEARAEAFAGGILGLLVLAGGLGLAGLAAEARQSWLLVPCAVVLGSAYGLCLVAGLLEVQRLAPERALAGLTATYYAFTYLGFAAPYLLAVAAGAAGYTVLLLMASVLAVVTAALVRQGRAPPGGDRRCATISRVTRTPAELQHLRDLALLRRVRDRIDREYAQPLDVEALARDAHMSAGHLSREFRRAYGESPYSYLMTRRIERAMALLRRGDLSVTEVCFEVGCASLGTFSTRFSELVGMPPSAYRRDAAGATAGMPACVAKQVTKPIRNREAQVTQRS